MPTNEGPAMSSTPPPVPVTSLPTNEGPAATSDGPLTTARKRRAPELVAEEKRLRDAKRLAREKERKEKEEETRRKAAEKVVRQQLTKRAKMEKIPRFTWTTGATEDLVQLVAQLKFEHDCVLETKPGFVSWSKFFKENADRKQAFDSLKEVPFEALERRYKAICTTYKASTKSLHIHSLICLFDVKLTILLC